MGSISLFDNEKDPQRLRSVYAEPAYAKTVENLKAELNQLRTLYKDTDDAEANAPPARRNRPARNPWAHRFTVRVASSEVTSHERLPKFK